ncbi:hypothetical protein GCM10023310_70490 [Paenibacillus vulneris]|uniref:Uncharacterized protein n=1 Tax=Paenibacillus vulneris TaxID=1133364 RepID=A0ABW3UJ15_9BACL
MIIVFSECPQILQDEVLKQQNKRFDKYKWATTITGCEKWISTPYIDKTITVTTYVVYAECLNVFETFKYEICSNSEFSAHREEVVHNSIIAGDIAGHIRHSKYFMTWFGDDIEKVKNNKSNT